MGRRRRGGGLAACLHVLGGRRARRTDWSDIPRNPTGQQVLTVLLDPNFGGFRARLQEAVALIVVAAFIAVVMWRARKMLRRQLAAERDRATISGIFGRFVPQTIVDAMIARRGVLVPVEREATVLFADIAGFTAMTERAGAPHTVEIMNAYFDEVTKIIGAANGVVAQFHGDAVMAIFTVPVEDPRHALASLPRPRRAVNLVAPGESDSRRGAEASADLDLFSDHSFLLTVA
jgi:adenylate cyclase